MLKRQDNRWGEGSGPMVLTQKSTRAKGRNVKMGRKERNDGICLAVASC